MTNALARLTKARRREDTKTDKFRILRDFASFALRGALS
jgi:hypothetical protein